MSYIAINPAHEENEYEALRAFLAEEHDIHLTIEEVEAAEDLYGGSFDVDGMTFEVLRDHELEERIDNALDAILDCELERIPEDLRFYFDEEAWKRDAKLNGVDDLISPVDGNIFEVGRVFNIIQVN